MVFGGISRVDNDETFVHGGSDETAGCRATTVLALQLHKTAKLGGV